MFVNEVFKDRYIVAAMQCKIEDYHLVIEKYVLVSQASKIWVLHSNFLTIRWLFGRKRLVNEYRWKAAVGPWKERPGHFGDVWKYWNHDGLGYFEFLQGRANSSR
ncbi:uncharacterized protein [Cicer arietinum]|uniref:uncharacterized protein isoform X1 n=1 Tax=Cicer arietinum TaxID=3827 RepID=UPI003CC5B40C